MWNQTLQGFMKILSLINENTLTRTSSKHFLMCMVINLASIKKSKKILEAFEMGFRIENWIFLEEI